MRILEACIHTPLAKALGLTLVHFLWEGALIALVLAALLFLCGPGPARLRYALCCLAMLAMPAVFGITIAMMQPAAHSAPVIALLPPAPPTTEGMLAAPPQVRPWTVRVREALPWVVPFWMAGVILFHVRSLGSWMAVRRLRSVGVCVASVEWQQRLDRLRLRLHLSLPVAFLESCLVDVPVVIGFLRPAILMPVGLLMGLATDQLESILLHELAHIRRRDYLVNLLQSFVEGMLFYHPAVWWISGLVRAERENCCDDVVVHLKGDARAYAAALVTLETSRWTAREPALAATGGSLMRRIHRLLHGSERPRTAAAPIFVTGLLIVSLAIAVGGWQSKPATAPAPVIVPDVQPALAAPQPDSRPLSLVAQARPQTQSQPELQPQAEAQIVPDGPYGKWLTQDVAYIISDSERRMFKSLATNEERESFIEAFWLRRDPTPGTPENEMKEEHYRRIAYANEHFASKIPGWKTDRGRIYITFGPPDEIDSHPAGGAYQRPAAEGGGTTSTFPFEQWRYRWIDGIGNDVKIEFVDPTMSGEYRMTVDPNEKDALRFVVPPFLPGAEAIAKAGSTVQSMGKGAALITIPTGSFGDHKINVAGRIVTASDRQPITSFETTMQGPAPAFTRFVGLQAGSYRLVVLVRDATTGTTATDDIGFEVK